MAGYKDIADAIRTRIASGNLPAGEMLPTLTELMKTWGVSRMTAIKAVQALEQEGLVATRGGRQAMVAPTREVPCPDWAAEMFGVQPGVLIRAQRINGSIVLRLLV